MNQRIQYSRFAVLVLVAVLAFPFAPMFFHSVIAGDNNNDPDIEKILRERLVVLQEAAELQRAAYQSGTASFFSMLAAKQTVLDAELELATTSEDRVRIRDQSLKNAEEFEKAAEEHVKSGEGSRMDLLSAKANRLRATADLMLESKTKTP